MIKNSNTTTTGKALIEKINSLSLPENVIAIWFLGQTGFVLKGREKIIYIDPYFSDYFERFTTGKPKEDKRQYLPQLKPHNITNADYLFGSYLYFEHIDPDMVLIANKKTFNISADLLIPTHFGMHEANTDPPGYFVDYNRITFRPRGFIS